MNINRQTTYRVILPALGMSLAVVAFASASSSHSLSRTSNSIVGNDTSTEMSSEINLDTPQVSVSVNGAPVQLNTQGQASVTTPNGSSVHVLAPPTQTGSSSSTTSSPTSVGIQYHVESSNSGSTTSPSGSSSTSVHVYGGTTSHSSSFSTTAIYGNGSDHVEINSSN